MTEPPVRGEKLNRFRSKLEAERELLQQLVQRMDELGLSASQAESLGELSTYDNHPADIGDELFERSKDQSLKHMLGRQLKAVEDALSRIESGRYGLCSDCGRPIPLERLDALPSAELCVACRAAHERFAPADESLAATHLRHIGQATGDEGRIGYDQEEAWREVERYGTSSTPSDDSDHPVLQ